MWHWRRIEISWTDSLKTYYESQGGNQYPTYKKRREGNWIRHIWRGNCHLKHIIEVKTEENI